MAAEAPATADALISLVIAPPGGESAPFAEALQKAVAADCPQAVLQEAQDSLQAWAGHSTKRRALARPALTEIEAALAKVTKAGDLPRAPRCYSELVGENPEGYCRLWAYLLHELSEAEPQRTRAFLASCVGSFRLLPHRCADLVLSAWEQEESAALQLQAAAPQRRPARAAEALRVLGVDVAELVALRFSHHRGSDQGVCPPWAKNQAFREVVSSLPGCDGGFHERVPASLYCVTAMLIRDGLLHYSQLQPFFVPSLEVLQQDAAEFAAAKLAAVDALSGIDRRGCDVEYYGVQPPQYKANDHYGVVIGLLRCGAVAEACDMLDAFASLHPLCFPPLARAVAAVATAALEPLAERARAADAAGQQSVAADIIATLESHQRLLVTLGHRLSSRLRLFGLLVEVVHFAQTALSGAPAGHGGDEEEEDSDDDEGAYAELKARCEAMLTQLATHSFLPALHVMTGLGKADQDESGRGYEDDDPVGFQDLAPSSLGVSVWGLIRRLPYRTRYKMYGQIVGLFRGSDFELRWATAKVDDATSKILRRITHENTGELAKQLAKFSEASPTAVFQTMFRQVMGYGIDVIPAIVDTLKQFSPLALDVMSYYMVNAVSDEQRRRLKVDKVNLEDWLSNIGCFTAHFYRKHVTRFDVRPMLNFMLWQAKRGRTHELTILSEMLKAAGFDNSEDYGEMHKKALGAGPFARVECSHLHEGQGRTNPRATAKLMKALRKELCQKGVADGLVRALARMQQRCIYRHSVDMGFRDGVNLRMVRSEFDRVHSILMQVVRFSTLTGALHKNDRLPKVAGGHDPRTGFSKTLTYSELVASGVAPAVAHTIVRHRYTKRPALGTPEHLAVLGETDWKSLLPAPFNEAEQFYLAFWSMDLCDLTDKDELYDELASAMKKLGKDEERNRDEHGRRAYKERERDWEHHRALMLGLDDERRELKKYCKKVKASLTECAKDILAPVVAHRTKPDLYCGVLHSCAWPRSKISVEDAIYSARFLLLVGPHGFPVVRFLLFVCARFVQLLMTCTDAEVARLGAFMDELLREWAVSFRDKKQLDNSGKQLTPDMYIRVHAYLARGVLRCLKNTETPHEQKMAIEFLRAVKDQFPVHKSIWTAIGDAVKPLTENEFLRPLATAYLAILNKRKELPVADYNKADESRMRALLSAPEDKVMPGMKRKAAPEDAEGEDRRDVGETPEKKEKKEKKEDKERREEKEEREERRRHDDKPRERDRDKDKEKDGDKDRDRDRKEEKKAKEDKEADRDRRGAKRHREDDEGREGKSSRDDRKENKEKHAEEKKSSKDSARTAADSKSVKEKDKGGKVFERGDRGGVLEVGSSKAGAARRGGSPRDRDGRAKKTRRV